MKRAFTLIELLVVVLIIGILSSIALPQYQKAVEKARFTTYETLGSSLSRAVSIAYLEGDNTWPTSLDQLAANLPGDMSTQVSNTYGVCRKNSKMFCCMTFPNSGANIAGAVRCGDNSYHLAYVRSHALPDGKPTTGVACIAKEEKYKAICKSISGVSTPTTTSTFTPDGWKTGYFYYTSVAAQ